MRKVNCSMKTKVTALERQVTFKGNEVKLGLGRITLEDEGWRAPPLQELEFSLCRRETGNSRGCITGEFLQEK